MGIKPIKRTNVSNKVFEQLRDQIITGEWKPGIKIPSENELAQQLNVSRITVRQALQKLTTLGLLETRPGEGSYVKELSPGIYMNSLIPLVFLGDAATMEVLEFRQVIEVETAGLAAVKATKEDIDKLEKILEKMHEYKNDPEEFAAEDLNFHKTLAEITKNSLIIQVNYIIKDILSISMKDIVKTLGSDIGLYYHEKIIEALKTKDRAKARQIMEEHVLTTMENMLQKKNKNNTSNS
ncbi:MAG: transcriptional regulator, GntR family [Clostridia bacterium]|jgi:GntR family transcriptional repressor for pyruvate dehydrogenase complex|nr:transcriptional regulator, GntR family [Clostridia bacterium]